jgi:hypothetical protein
VEIRLATPEDDRALCDLVRASTLPGEIQLVLARSPSFFDAAPVLGSRYQVMVATDPETGALIGMAERAERRLFVNGAATDVGYLSGVRIRPGHRGGTLLARGFRYLRELHRQGAVRLYLSTIAAENRTAIEVLTSGRTSLPAYHPFGTYRTFAIPVPGRTATRSSPGLTIEPAREADLTVVMEFVRREGARRQFFPCCTAGDLAAPGAGPLKGMVPADLLVAWREGRPAGTLARWDQRAYKQSVVTGYSGWTRIARPFYNALSSVLRRPALPAPGHRVESVHLALAVAAGDDLEVFRTLLDAAIAREAGRGTAYLSLGLHERDPLASALRPYRPIEIRSLLYVVTFEDDGEAMLRTLDDRIPYVELGTL